jgi:hypothetical protein
MSNGMDKTDNDIVYCGMAMKSIGMLGVSVRKMKALTVKVQTVTLIGEGR